MEKSNSQAVYPYWEYKPPVYGKLDIDMPRRVAEQAAEGAERKAKEKTEEA
ncbi:MAG: hypothetical protein KAW12_13805 [Candidatus Aminicenantes bacterium]|nr:hypothetical protein [Candidatus Aminicenantes bacterium]